MRFQTVKGVWAIAAVLVVVALVGSACELKPPATAQAAPSPQQSPSPSPEPTPLAITAPAWHNGEVTVAFAPIALAATGGTPPYQWTVGAGASLPGGLTLTPDGSLSGTPSAAGDFAFSVHVADNGGRTADAPGAIKILAAPTAALTSECSQYCAVEQGCDSTCGSFGTVAGGTPPYTAAIQGGYVPKGVGVTVAGPTLAMAGTFTSPAKFWQFTVVVTDSLGASTGIAPIFYVYPHISMGTSTSCDASFWGIGCTASLPYSDGTPGGTPSVSIASAQGTYCPGPNYQCSPTSSPPPGFTVSASGGTVSIAIPPQNRPGYTYTGTVTLSLVDQSVCAANTYCSATATVTVSVQAG